MKKTYSRKRNVRITLRVSPEEKKLIEQRMEQAGIVNMNAFLRKMAIDGHVIRLELPELRELVALLRRSSNNLNQLTRRVNTNGRIYESELTELQQTQDKQCMEAREIVKKLSTLI